VTQSGKQSTTLKATATANGIVTTESGTITGDAKIDLSNFNARIDEAGTVEAKAGGMSQSIKTEEKIILNVAKKLIVIWTKQSNATSGTVLLQNCSALTIDKMPSKIEFGLAFNVLKGVLQKAAVCKGNDGKYDTWDVSVDHKKDDPWPAPIPGITLPPMNLALDLKLKMDTDYLLHSEVMHLHQDSTINGTTTNITEDSTTTVTEPTASGPTDTDLDYSSWGTCTPIHPKDTEFLHERLAKAANPMKKLLLATLVTSMESRAQEEIVI